MYFYSFMFKLFHKHILLSLLHMLDFQMLHLLLLCFHFSRIAGVQPRWTQGDLKGRWIGKENLFV